MRIEIARNELSRLLTAVTRVVEDKNTYPILANVLLTADAETLMVRGTDLDIEVTATGAAKCVPGVCTAPAKKLADIAKRAAGDTVTLELQGDVLAVKSGRSRYTLPVLPPDSFPTLNVGTFSHEFRADLAALFAPVAFAISSEETRYYLNGIYLHVVGDELRGVATDGHRLSRHTAAGPVPEGARGMPGVIIPAKTVGIVPAGEIDVAVSDTKIRYRAAATDTRPAMTILSKLIEGTFPDYERVTPKNNGRLCAVSREDLVAAVGRVGLVANDRSGKAVRLSLAPDSMVLGITTDSGTAEDEVAAEYDGEPFAIGFNVDYLADVLGAVAGPKVRFAFDTPNSPAVVSGEGNGMIVLMPQRIVG